MENKRVMKILKTEEFQTGLKAIVVDEAHLVVDWYVNVDLYIITNKCEKLCHVYCLFHYLNNNNTVSRKNLTTDKPKKSKQHLCNI